MTIEQKAREIAASALRARKMPSPSYEAIDVEAGKYDEHSSVQAARLGIIEGLEMAIEVVQTARFTNPESLRDSIVDAIRALIGEKI